MGVSFEVEIKFAGFGLSLLYRVLMSVDFIDSETYGWVFRLKLK